MLNVVRSTRPIVRLGELAAEESGSIAIGPFGSSLKAEVYTDAGIPVVRGNNLKDRPGFYGEFVFVNEETAARFSRCIVRAGDLVFPHRGAIGEVGLAIGSGEARWLLSTSMMKFRPHHAKLDARYLYYFFRSKGGRQQLLQNASQVGTPGIGQPLASLRACEIPVPSLPEQRAIAVALSTLDDKIDSNRRANQMLERLARAIFQAWFVDFEPVKAKAAAAILFPGMPQDIFDALPARLVESELGLIPEGWEVGCIGDVVSVRGGGTPSTKIEKYWEGGTHFWLTPKDLSGMKDPVLLSTARKITDTGLERISSSLLPIGTVLLSSRAPVGYLVISGVPTAINQGFIAMVCNGPLPPLYVYHWTRSVMNEIKSRASGTTFPEISKSAFRPIKVCIPKGDVLTAFTAVVEPLFDKLAANIKETASLETMRDYLLPKLLSGEVRVREEQQPESVVI